MTEEIARLREDIQKMQEDTFTNRLKKSLSEAADRLEKRCDEIKQQIFEVKESIKSKTGEIMADFKMRGKAALNRVSEFIGLKDKLVGIRNKVKEGIADTNRTILQQKYSMIQITMEYHLTNIYCYRSSSPCSQGSGFW